MSKSRSLGGATSSRASSSTARLKVAPPKAASPSTPPANDLDAIDPAFLRGSIKNLKETKRTIIHSTAAHADRIPGLLPHLTCTVGGLNEIISKLIAALPVEARP